MRCIEQANPDTLHGIFGDAKWPNKDHLPDHMLRVLIEHFSSQTLSLSNCPEDELGVGYEFLIKKFADDSGHTAAEFLKKLFDSSVMHFNHLIKQRILTFLILKNYYQVQQKSTIAFVKGNIELFSPLKTRIFMFTLYQSVRRYIRNGRCKCSP
jgi:hypothetical protein